MKYLFIATFYFFSSGIIICQTNIDLDWLVPKLDSLLELGMDSMAFPGAQVVVRVDDKVVINKAYGYQTYEKEKLVGTDDLYDMASITKVSTGLPLLMRYWGAGGFELDDTWSDLYPPMRGSNKSQLKVIDILSHRAGLQPYIVFWANAKKSNDKWKFHSFCNKESNRFPIHITDELFLYKNYSRKMLREVKKTPLTPEGEYHYSGLFFLTLPRVLETMSNRNFEISLYKTIFIPIGANQLVYNPVRKGVHLENIIPTEVDTFFRKELVHGTVHDEAAAMLNGISCNAGLFGNAEDLSKLFQLYLNKGNWHGNQIIPAKAVEEFTSYHFADEDNHRGLGFDKPLIQYDADKSYCAKSASSSSFGHSGFTGTFVWADPEYDMVFVFLSNRVYPSRENRKLYTLSLRPQMHELVYQAIKRADNE